MDELHEAGGIDSTVDVHFCYFDVIQIHRSYPNADTLNYSCFTGMYFVIF